MTESNGVSVCKQLQLSHFITLNEGFYFFSKIYETSGDFSRSKSTENLRLASDHRFKEIYENDCDQPSAESFR